MQVRMTLTNKTSGDSTEVDLSVEDTVVIGRHLGSPMVLQGEGLSRHHFLLSTSEGALSIEDLSSNGTRLNGNSLKPKISVRVNSGDVIEIPGYELRIEDIPESSAGAPAEPAPSKTTLAGARSLKLIAGLLEPRETLLATFALFAFGVIAYVLNS